MTGRERFMFFILLLLAVIIVNSRTSSGFLFNGFHAINGFIESQAKPTIRSNFTVLAKALAHKPFALVCLASGNPAPTIEWFLRGSSVTEGAELTSRVFSLSRLIASANEGARASVLHFRPLLPSDDQANVSCRSTNVLGVDDQRLSLHVYPNPFVLPRESQRFVENDQTSSAIEAAMNQTTQLKCPETVDEPKHFQWFKGDFPVTTGAGNSTNLVTGSTLEITQTRQEDAGHYACLVEGAHVTRMSASVELVVVPPPKAPSRVETGVTDNQVSVQWATNGASNFSVECQLLNNFYSWFPMLWLNNLQEPNRPERLQTTFRELPRGGHFQIVVRASNRLGYESQAKPVNFTIPPQIPSSPPLLVHGSAISNTMVSLSWQPPFNENATALSYVIFYTENPTAELTRWQNFPIGATNSTILTHLERDQEYAIRVGAHNKVGLGPISSPIFIKTAAKNVSGPCGLTLVQRNREAISIAWMDMRELMQPSQLSGYRLECRMGPARIVHRVPPAVHRLRLPRGVDTCQLHITLKGGQESGRSSIAFTAEQTEVMTVERKSASSLHLTWKAEALANLTLGHKLAKSAAAVLQLQEIDEDEGGGKDREPAAGPAGVSAWPDGAREDKKQRIIFSANLANVRANNFHGLVEDLTITGLRSETVYAIQIGLQLLGQTSTTFHGLLFSLPIKTPAPRTGFGSTYEFRVAARNRIGYGSETSARVMIPPEAPSDAPSGIELTGSKENVTISWAPPREQYRNGNITMYQLRIYKDGLEHSSEAIFNLTSKAYSLLDLPPATYHCYVRAINPAGPGPWTDRIVIPIDPPTPSPSPPSRIRAVRLSERSMSVEWEPPETTPSQGISHYNLWYATSDSQDIRDWTKTVSEGPVTKHILTDLDALESYVIRVSTVNFQGVDGRWSNLVIPKTFLTDDIEPQGGLSSESLLSCVSYSAQSLNLSWRMSSIPQSLNGFKLVVDGMRQFVTEAGTRRQEHLGSLTKHIRLTNAMMASMNINYKLDDLQANAEYSIALSEVHSARPPYGANSTLLVAPKYIRTPEIVGIQKPEPGRPGYAKVKLYRASEENGPIHRYYIVVTPDPLPSDRPTQHYWSSTRTSPEHDGRSLPAREYTLSELVWNQHLSSSQAPYLALYCKATAMFTVRDTQFWLFNLGDELNWQERVKRQTDARVPTRQFERGARNKPLNPITRYRVALGACSELIDKSHLCNASEWSEAFRLDGDDLFMSDSTKVDRNIYNKRDNVQSSASRSNVAVFAGVLVSLGVVFSALLVFGFVFYRKRRKRHFKARSLNFTRVPGNLLPSRPAATPAAEEWLLTSTKLHMDDMSAKNSDLRLTGSSYCTPNSNYYFGDFSSVHSPSMNKMAYDRQMLPMPSPAGLSGFPGSHPLANCTVAASDSGTGLNFVVGSTSGHGTMDDDLGSNQSPGLRIDRSTLRARKYPPVHLASLAEYLSEGKRTSCGRNLLEQEFESLEAESDSAHQPYTCNYALMDTNVHKNRYPTVNAYDHSRVVLQNGSASDYINANYLDGFKRQNAYIATQGPMENTVEDFWQMVLEQRAPVIVMLSQLVERGRVKCASYWPTRGTIVHGTIFVTLLDCSEYAHFIVRRLQISQQKSLIKHEVWQLQYTFWPEVGLPAYTSSFLEFVKRVCHLDSPKCGPMIVHCSAGVGRTVDQRSADIYGTVLAMRRQRSFMVQTSEQYAFLYDCVLEASQDCDTELTAGNLGAFVNKLRMLQTSGCVNFGENATGFEVEFKQLKQSDLLTSSAYCMEQSPSRSFRSTERNCSCANLPENQAKNRVANVVPFDWNRVSLDPIRGVPGSDYINASHVDGFRMRHAYIVTQAPLCQTVEDFWRMVWEHQCSLLVMLCQLTEGQRESCYQYWPTDRPARYQFFVIDPVAEYTMTDFIMREFKVTDARDGQSRTVRQFQFTSWPEHGLPNSCGIFTEFISQVHKTKEQFGQDGPITVHCNVGAGRSGVFVAASMLLERLRQESAVDVFHTVKMLRQQRLAMVQTAEQYKFCYLAALDYLNSYDLCNNTSSNLGFHPC